jgi:hypothetical protein
VEWLLLLVIAGCTVTGIRVVSDTERIAVHQFGRFAGFRQPGLRFKIPGGPDVWSRLRLGMRGEVLAPQLAQFGKAEVPIQASLPLEQGQFVRIDGFGEQAVLVILDAVQTRTLRCQRCGHENSL